LVFSDDCDLPAGRLRIRPSGSAGGHNGLKSLIAHVGTEAFTRVRLGAGRSPEERRGLIDFVLHRFSEAEAEVANQTATVAAEAALFWLDHSVQETQNRFNAVRTTNNQEKL
jgi:PTH1 family peptidyl-tRNA hydrolase